MAVATENKVDEVVMGREKSDDRVVPKGRRKAVPTGASRGGKAVTASECAGQLEMFLGTAESPKGATTKAERGEPLAASHVVPKPRPKTGTLLRPMTMEEVASPSNLALAFSNVAKNDGAPGPDRTSVSEVREHLGDVLDRLHRCLLDGSYRPGLIRRVWIPKPGGDKRGLGIPNVVDRIVQQAVLQVLSPQYEPTFHGSSHGFRPGRSCHTAIAEACLHLEEGLEWGVLECGNSNPHSVAVAVDTIPGFYPLKPQNRASPRAVGRHMPKKMKEPRRNRTCPSTLSLYPCAAPARRPGNGNPPPATPYRAHARNNGSIEKKEDYTARAGIPWLGQPFVTISRSSLIGALE
jgi:hypothetical protein